MGPSWCWRRWLFFPRDDDDNEEEEKEEVDKMFESRLMAWKTSSLQEKRMNI